MTDPQPEITPETLPDPAAAGWTELAETGFSQSIGPFWTRPGAAQPLWAIRTDDRHRNNNGGVHGGLIAALADHAMGNVARRAVDGRATATIQMDVHYLAAGRLGEFLVAHSTLVRQTRSIVFMRCEITAGTRVVATGTGVWKILGA
jgi:uncharacterized protein (TIGR00369 family)